jgi:Glycosyltransferase family 87
MNEFFSRAWSTLMLIGLVGYLLGKGVVPALSQIDADFPGYFTAAKIVVDGQDTSRLYDDDWFREQIRRYGLESAKNPGKFAPFPPPTALLIVPLARFEPLTALRILTVVSVLGLIGSIFLLARILSWRPLDAAFLVLLSGGAIITGLRCGQPYILASTACILGYYLYLRRKPWLAGICFGLFVPIKYFPIIILGCFALQKEWKVLAGGAVAIGSVALLSVAVLGWQVHQVFLASILGNHLLGHLSLQALAPPFTAVYQSFDTLFNRLFRFDATLNPHPLLIAPTLATLGSAVAKGAILLVTVATLVKLARTEGSKALAPSIGIALIFLLLVAPATATYMCVLLWLPVGLLIEYFRVRGDRTLAYFLLGAYTLVGFFPWQYTYPFEGRGALTVLAYPRLFVQLAMLVACAWYIGYPRRLGAAAASAAAHEPVMPPG